MHEYYKASKEVRVIRRVTWVGFWVNVVLMTLKLFFGYWGHSDALVADGYHSMSDFATDFIVLIFVGIAYKKADEEHPYGHGKFETMASVLIGLILMIVAIALAYGGIESLIKALKGEILPKPDIWTLIIAFVSIVSKEWLFRYTRKEGCRIDSSALKANAWHHRSDAISSVATLVGVAAAIFLGEKWRILDPIASVLIALFIAYSAVEICRPAVEELLEVSLPENQLEQVKAIIRETPGVRSWHRLRTRRNGHSFVLDTHIKVDPDITVREGHAIASLAEKRLRHYLGPDLICYIHVEPAS